MVNRAGDQLLAGTGFAADQHRGSALRHLAHHAEHAAERLAAADDLVEVVMFLALVAEVIEFVAQPLELERRITLQ